MVLVDKIVANCLASNITAIEDYSLIFVAPATVIRTFLGVSTEQKSRKVEKEDCRVTEAYFGNPSSGVQRCVPEMTANYQLFSDMPSAKTEKGIKRASNEGRRTSCFAKIKKDFTEI